MSTFLRRGLLATAAVVTAALILIGMAHLPFVRVLVLQWARAQLRESFGIVGDAGTLRYNLFSLSMELSDVTLGVQGERPFLQADSVQIALSRQALRGVVELERLTVSRPRLVIVRHSSGTTNLPIGGTGSSSASTPLRLGTIQLNQVSAEIADEAAGRNVSIGPIDLTLDSPPMNPRLGAFGPASFTVGLTPSVGTLPPKVLSGTVAGRLGFDGARLNVAELHVDTPEGQLDLDGSVDVVAETPNMEARGRLQLDLARAASLMDVAGGAVAGSADTRFEAAGSLSGPVVRIVISGQDLGYQSLTGAELSASATYAAGRLEIEQLDITSSLGEAHASGALVLATPPDPPGASRIVARLTGVDLDSLLNVAEVDVPLPLGASVSAEIGATLEGVDLLNADWLQDLSADARVRVAPASSGLSLDGGLDIRLRAGKWTLEHTLQSLNARAALNGVAGGQLRRGSGDRIDSTLSVQSRLRADNLGAVVLILRQAGLELPTWIDQSVAGSVEASLESRGTVRSPTILASVAGRGIRVADVPAADLDSTLAIDRRAVTAQTLEARIGSSRVTASGRYAWSGRIAAAFEATAADLGEVARSFGLTDVPVVGSARLAGDVEGPAQSLQARADLAVQSLSVEDTPIGAVNATLELSDRRLKFNARAPELNLQADGNLDTREPLAYQVVVNLDRSSIPALLPESWRSRIPIDRGTATGSVMARGLLRQPLDTTAEAIIQALDLSLSGVPFVLEAPATISVGPAVISTTSLQLRIGQRTHVQLQGALAQDQALEGVQIRVDGALSELLEVAVPILPDVPIDASGSIGIDVRVGGTLRAPQPEGTITVRDGVFHYRDLPPLTDVALSGRIDRSEITLQSLTAAWQSAKVVAEGVLPLRMIAPEPQPGGPTDGITAWGSQWLASLPAEPGSATVVAKLSNLTPDVLAPFMTPSQLQKISAAASATVTAEADGFALERVRASAVLEQGALELAGVPFTQTVPTRLRLEDGYATVEDFRWNAQGNEVIASGRVNLADADLAVDLALSGAVDLRVVNMFTTGVASGGIARPNLTVTGPLTAPRIVGDIGVTAGELQIEAPPIVASDFSGTISIAGNRTATVSLKGLVNAGAAALAGEVDLEKVDSPRGRLSLTARDVSLEFPDGFQTESNADLALTLSDTGSTLTGRIDVLNGIYREPILLSRGILSGLGSADLTTTAPESSFLTSLRLDVALATSEDVRIENNYGRLNATANLRIEGTGAQPAVIGRVEVQPDGEIYLGGNTFRVQTLIIEPSGPLAATPNVIFLADTRVGNVPIEVSLQCGPGGPCEREVRSQAAGVTNEEAEAMLFGVSSDPSVAGAQLASLLSGELLGVVGQSVGLDTLRLEQGAGGRADLFDDPTLVAGDVNPASRLTLGKRVGEHVELAYSQDLAENGFTTSTTYSAPAGISLRALLLDDQSRSYEFRHEPLSAAPRRARPTTEAGPTIASVRIAGTPGFPEAELRGRLQLAEGDRFEFTRWQDDRERLNALYQSRGFFEARVRARRLPTTAEPDAVGGSGPVGESIVLEYTVEQGPATRLDVIGVDLPEAVRNRIIARWASAIFDGFLERDARLLVREHLYREGRLQATVAATIRRDQADGVKTLRIEVSSGPAMTPRLEFTGNTVVPTSRLLEVAQAVGLSTAWLDPPSFARAIERLYRDEGLLSAEINVGEPAVQNETSVVRIVIREGEPWLIRSVTLGGTDVLPGGAAPESLGLPANSPYVPRIVDDRIRGLERRFREAGFLDARVVSEIVLDPQEHNVDVHVLVQSGSRSVLSGVAVEGARADSPIISRNVNLTVGAPVTGSLLSDVRRRLYDTGVYRSVEIDLEPADETRAPNVVAGGGDLQVVARVHVEERPRYRLRYGLAYRDDVVAPDERERRLGFAADLENRNLLGFGGTAGLSARVRPDQLVGRLFVGANSFFGLPVRSNVFVSRSRENIGSDQAFPTVSDVTELSAEQRYRLRRLLDFRYGYSLGRNRTTIEGSDFDVTVRVARLNATGLVDRRNDPFDPAHGSFTSANVELSRPGLGSDLSFVKSFVQQFLFLPIHDRLVFASAARLGTAWTFKGEDLIPSERFYGGGATSIRGYREDDLGPRSIFGDADGGRGLFILNSELRFPVYRWLRSVGFVDLGNVYQTIADIFQSGLQVGAGGGIRLDTPIGLLRLDVAAPVNPRPADPKWRVHFGLGHSF